MVVRYYAMVAYCASYRTKDIGLVWVGFWSW